MDKFIGLKFNRLTVLSLYERRKYLAYYKCRCDCGNECIVYSYNLKNGHTKSCGCYNIQLLKGRSKHNMCGTNLYYTYNGILDRCESNNKNYGGRGIKCEWNNFQEFYNDMGSTYKKGLTIDRIDNNGNYCKNNCKRATAKEQANNRRTNIIIEYKGIKKNITQWEELLGLNRQYLYQSILIYGRTFDWVIKHKKLESKIDDINKQLQEM